MFFTVVGCQSEGQLEKNIQQNQEQASKSVDTRLTFENVTLEQSNVKGETLWKIKAERVIYSQDQKIAHLEKITGNLFQDGKLIIRIQAEKGEIEKNGEEVFLKEKIVATDQRNKAVFNGDQAEWRPKEDLFIVQNNLKATYPKFNVSAQEGRYISRKQQLELIGKIVGFTTEPTMQLKTEHLFWEIKNEKVIGDRPVKIDRYKDKEKIITDQLVAEKIDVDLKTKTALVKQNVELKSVKPPIQIATNSATWDYGNRSVKSNIPVQIFHRQEQITVTGNQGKIDLNTEIAYLWGGVQGINSRNKSQLYANSLRWQIPSQMLEAEGNVIYKQADPPLDLTGPKAVGKLQDNSIVIQGNSNEQVETTIIPN